MNINFFFFNPHSVRRLKVIALVLESITVGEEVYLFNLKSQRFQVVVFLFSRTFNHSKRGEMIFEVVDESGFTRTIIAA